MNIDKIRLVKRLARELLDRIDAVDKRSRGGSDQYWLYGCKETAALRRTSMELTRALADMRKPG